MTLCKIYFNFKDNPGKVKLDPVTRQGLLNVSLKEPSLRLTCCPAKVFPGTACTPRLLSLGQVAGVRSTLPQALTGG